MIQPVDAGRVACGLLLAALVVAGAHAQDAGLARRLETQKSMLQQLEADLSSARAESERMRETEQDAAGRFVEAANRVGLIEHSLSSLANAETALVQDISAAEHRRARILQQVGDRESLMARRVRTLYVEGRRHPYQRALLASTLAHWMAARQYMTTLNRRDEIDVRHLTTDRIELDSVTAIYRDQRRTLDTLIARRQVQRRELVAAREDAERYLTRIRRSRRLAESAARELEGQRQESQQRIADYLVERERAGSTAHDDALVGGISIAAPVDFSTQRGSLPWPIDGPVVGEFGRRRDRESRTWTRSRGIDIGAPLGTEVRSVASGRVVLVDWYRGYGTFAIVAHGQDYYTLYAHLGGLNVRPDDHVRRGQIIGVSGSPGALGVEGVHFEIMVGHEALNPRDWLAAPQPGAS